MGNKKTIIYGLISLTVCVLILYVGVWQWMIERTWVPEHYSLQLTQLTGGGAPKDGYAQGNQQGVEEQMRGPGRHFLTPWEYSTKLVKDFEVPAGQIALVRNNIGKELPEGRFLADPGERGVQKLVLTPGVWRLNEFGQTHYVQPQFAGKGLTTQPQVYIPPGYVGVQTMAEGPNKGILPQVLQAGYYTINPEEVKVTIVGIGYDVIDIQASYENVRITDKDGNEKTVLRPKEGTGVSFPLADGKQMYLDITVVWGVFPENAPRVVSDYGTLDMLEEKIIRPQVLSICKNAGSDLTTRDFIAGESREKFQERFTQELQKIGKEKGITFLIALVRGFHPDPEIAETIQAKMLAEEEMITLSAERERDTVAADLEAAKRKVDTALKDFDAETTALVAEEREEGLKQAATVEADAKRRVAAIDRQVAETNAQAATTIGQADADVIEMTARAQADLMKMQVAAYGGADNFNLATFAKSLPDDLKIEYHYSGPGTMWTDLKSMEDAAARKILSPAAPAVPAAARTDSSVGR